MSNLRLINETTVSSSVSTVSVTDIFSADFDIYKIVGNFTCSGGSDASLQFINSSGSVISASSYDWAMLIMKGETSFVEYKNTGQTNMTALFHGTEQGSSNTIYAFNPFNSSAYSFVLGQTSGKSGSNLRTYKNIGVLKQTASMTGFKLTFDVNATSGSVRTYGLGVS